MRRLLPIVMLLLATACGGPPTVTVDLRLGEATPPVASLARLRLIVRVCGQNELALADNIDTNATDFGVEAAVQPGDTFYVWLQGWDQCNPPCVEDSLQAMNDQSCVCINDGQTPNYQVFRYEACSAWVSATEDALVPLTLAEVDRDSRLCPPPPRQSCDQ